MGPNSFVFRGLGPYPIDLRNTDARFFILEEDDMKRKRTGSKVTLKFFQTDCSFPSGYSSPVTWATAPRVKHKERVDGKLSLCKNGFHVPAETTKSMGTWARYCDTVALVRVSGDHVDSPSKSCWRSMVILKYMSWKSFLNMMSCEVSTSRSEFLRSDFDSLRIKHGVNWIKIAKQRMLTDASKTFS